MNFARRLFTGAFCAILSLPVYASEKEEVPGIMIPMREEILKLQPYLISDEKFTDKKNRKQIQKSLDALSQYAEVLPAHERLKTPGFAISAKVLQEQLEDTAEMFRKGSPKLARRFLNASLDACSSCHTQVVSNKGPLWDFPVDRVQGPWIDRANFWFTLRHYNKALEIYENILQQAPNKEAGLEDAATALERALTIQLRIRRSAAKAADTLTKAVKNTNLSQAIRERAAGWVEALKTLEVQNAPSSRSASAKAIEAYAQKQLQEAESESFKRLDDSQVVKFLFVSGLLYEFINFNPDKVSGEILYWLAVSDQWLNDQFFYSLSNLYLEQCVERFPNSKIAPRCYQELEEKIKLAYTGSSGVHLPKEEQQRLEELRLKVSSVTKQKSE